jgi:hypothetical protein
MYDCVADSRKEDSQETRWKVRWKVEVKKETVGLKFHFPAEVHYLAQLPAYDV